MTDEEAVAKLDGLIDTLKPASGPLALHLRGTLDLFVKAHGLDWDQHAHARLPKDRDPVTERVLREQVADLRSRVAELKKGAKTW